MASSVPAPKGAKVRRPVELRLKAGWRYDPERRVFLTPGGERCSPGPGLPRGTRIALKVPSLHRVRGAALSHPERELLRYVQVILPAKAAPADYVAAIAAWACVDEARLAPEAGLP